MTMQHLPRPWMLAALMDVPVAVLAHWNGRTGHALGRACPAPGRRRGAAG